MDNLQLPAYPAVAQMTNGEIEQCHQTGETTVQFYGFTKLELASLMIAQGLASDPGNSLTDPLAKLSVAFAKAVLEEANK